MYHIGAKSGLQVLKAPLRRFDVLQTQIDLGLSSVMRSICERVPQRLIRKHGLALEFVNLLVPLFGWHGLKRSGTRVIGNGEKLNGILLIHHGYWRGRLQLSSSAG